MFSTTLARPGLSEGFALRSDWDRYRAQIRGMSAGVDTVTVSYRIGIELSGGTWHASHGARDCVTWWSVINGGAWRGSSNWWCHYCCSSLGHSSWILSCRYLPYRYLAIEAMFLDYAGPGWSVDGILLYNVLMLECRQCSVLPWYTHNQTRPGHCPVLIPYCYVPCHTL